VYPEQSKALVDDILQKKRGAIISEFAIGVPPNSTNFPRRNRIMSGMGRGVLVAEAPEGSGSLITADHALEQGRDVFALPANITMNGASGTNRLIQEGATLITQAADILRELTVVVLPPTNQAPTKTKTVRPATKTAPKITAPSPPPLDLNDHEQKLYTLLNASAQHIDDLIRTSGLRTDIVISTITLLELKGLAQMVAPMQYCRAM
jgi:DNA processing protein